MKISELVAAISKDRKLVLARESVKPTRRFVSSTSVIEQYRLAREAHNSEFDSDRIDYTRAEREAQRDFNRKDFRQKVTAGFMLPLFSQVSTLVVRRVITGTSLNFARFFFRRLLWPVTSAVLSTVARGLIWTGARFLALTPLGIGVSLGIGTIAGLVYIWKKYQGKSAEHPEIQTAKEFKEQRRLPEQPEATVTPIEPTPKKAAPLTKLPPKPVETPPAPKPELKKPPSIQDLFKKPRAASPSEMEEAKKAFKRNPTIPDLLDNVGNRVGVDPTILGAIALQESKLAPGAKNPKSSAVGLFQFLTGTWNLFKTEPWISRIKKYGGFDIRKADRKNPVHSAVTAAVWWKYEIIPNLKRALGRNPNVAEVYAGHFLGGPGVLTFFRKLQENPDRIAALDMTKPAKDNPSIFYIGEGPSRRGRTYQEIFDWFRSKVGGWYAAYRSNENPTQIAEEDTPVKALPASIPPKPIKPQPPISSNSIPGPSLASNMDSPRDFVKIDNIIYAV